jgi:antitoxin component YwqK of YwqJK toxin-antitoxin module
MSYLLYGIVLVLGFSACDIKKPKEDFEKSPSLLVEKVLDKYPDGSIKAVEEYEVAEGVNKLFGYKEYYPSGKVKIEGRYNDQKQRTGLWQAFFENGNKWSIGTYTNGEENGEKRVWFENGKVRYTGQMKNNKPYGEWYVWDENGNESIKNFE